MPLSDITIKNTKPGDKARKLADERGLYLLVQPTGGKLWRLDYRFAGKRKTLALGGYPDVSLADARSRRDEARKLIAGGVDPSEVKRAQKAATVERAANSFEVIAREWFGKKCGGWAASHADKIIARLENDLFPWLGGRPIAEITPPEVLACIRRIEARGAIDTAHRALQNCGQVMRYAVATGRATRDPCGDLRGALPPAKEGHFAAITDPLEVGKLLRAMDEVTAGNVVRAALQLAPLLFVRPGELRTMKWADVDLEQCEWGYMVSKTKTEHLVPLAPQAVAILRDLLPVTGGGEYVFPSAKGGGEPMSNAAVNAALRRAGINTREQHSGHGFRAMARTLLHEELGIAPEVIEHQLAHRVPDSLGTAYNRTKFLADRKAMMNTWADYLDMLRAADGAKVVPLKTMKAAA